MGIPEHYFKSVKQSIIMVRKGKQKKARLERLKNEIVDYVIAVDQCSASDIVHHCLLYTSPSPRDRQKSRMPSSA